MPTLVIDNVPASLYDRIEHLAKSRRRTPADTVLEVLESALNGSSSAKVIELDEPPLPQSPFLTEEICAPFSLPRPEGKPVRAIHVPPPLPTPHDLPDEE